MAASTFPTARDTPALPCPECRLGGRAGGARIGNRRSLCHTCNNWARNVARIVGNRLRDNHLEEYLQLRLRVELDLYPSVIEQYDLTHPRSS